MESYAELKEKMSTLRKQMQETGKEEFRKYSQQIFEKYPLLESFSWTQFTPYFNDGDTCYFGVNTEPGLVYDGKKMNHYGELEDDIEIEDELEKKFNEISNEISKFIEAFDENDMEAMFGDHVEITVKKDTVEIEEYDHD